MPRQQSFIVKLRLALLLPRPVLPIDGLPQHPIPPWRDEEPKTLLSWHPPHRLIDPETKIVGIF